jgi:hypothetical protein
MNWPEFKKKWARYTGKETSAYQEHFNDLCRLLNHPTPAEADPTGSESFCFQKRVVKDAELFALKEDGWQADAADEAERGFADVWKKGCFGWEYKGKKKNLDAAYKQLLQYREALLNPRLLVVCDFDRFIIRTNFNGTVQKTHEFTNAQIDRPDNLRTLRACFDNPDFLKPQRTTHEVTKTLAEKFAQVAVSLQKRESAEYADARTRAEVVVAQKKKLRIARFLNRLIFCFFAEDTGLLPKKLFSEIAKIGLEDKQHFIETLQKLFHVMASGGTFGQHKIRHFNGHLFEDSTVFDLSDDERRILAESSEADWQFVEPSIMGTLFARGLDPDQRAALGAQYTGRDDIVTIVEPVLMAPLRREWAALRASLLPAFKQGKATSADRARIAALLKKLRQLIVLDPACGSGNFLYVSLQMLLDLEKEVITFATQLGLKFSPQVSVQQLRAIEINPYAFELAQVSVQIGFLQWRRDNGFDNDRSPVLQNLDGFQNEDALLVPHFHSKAKTLKEAQEGEHTSDDALKFYTEREWPKCEVIVSNPPFLGDKLMRGELGDSYVEELRRTYGDRIPGQSDLCCYWFEKAREQIERGNCKRAGLLATQGIRGGANREVLKRIKDTGDIFFAESDREWILNGAMVHVSMVGFDSGKEVERILNGKPKKDIPANLGGNLDITASLRLVADADSGFIGVSMHGPFDMEEASGLAMISESGNPNLKANSDVLRPVLNALEITKGAERRWLVSFPPDGTLEDAVGYGAPMDFVRKNVLPVRSQNHRKAYRDRWWLPGEARPAMQQALAGLPRFVATPRVSKYRVFVWISPECLPSDATVAFARADDYFFGLLHSRFHEIWALAQGTQLREKESGFRYTPTTCFETFPFPRATPAQEAVIAAAAKELNELRERWLNPPEWTETRTLEFPGSATGPWSRYVDPKTVDAKTGVGTVRYPCLEPRDADCAAKLKRRTLTNLYNEHPAWLELAHKKLDMAVACAYGWNDFAQILEHTDEACIYNFEDGTLIQLDTDAEGHAEAMEKFRRDFDEKILERLLALNLERAEEEAKADKVTKPKTSREKRADELV